MKLPKVTIKVKVKKFKRQVQWVQNNLRYPMCKDQPAQIDCRQIDCVCHYDGACHNCAPAITFNGDQMKSICWTYKSKNK
jgi:hypothetical protein